MAMPCFVVVIAFPYYGYGLHRKTQAAVFGLRPTRFHWQIWRTLLHEVRTTCPALVVVCSSKNHVCGE
ncbi:hypothetical protein Y032_0049g1851 [Ancylostoma ceylanicum]|uniref:Uncharacterized protein n=1 Tax=Ancylostoma ceylanicum TaxID=53326 RepID=A0A016U9C4_9BILA|nr:hypothetical protein Y032_0049g1851 [Ancylostoma ceylanicum]